MKHSITAAGSGSRAKLALAAFCGFAGIVGLGAASAATTAADVPTLVIRYDHQILGTDSGTDALYRRIVAAAKRVCPDASNRDLGAMSRAAACREQAVTRAIQQINSPRLAAIHASRSKNG